MTAAQSMEDTTQYDLDVFEAMPLGREVTTGDIMTRMGDKCPSSWTAYSVSRSIARINQMRRGAIMLTPYGRNETFYTRLGVKL